MAKWIRKTDGTAVLDTDKLKLSKSMRLLSTDLGQQLLGPTASKEIAIKQKSMFQTDDLPLFSQTAQRIRMHEYKARIAVKQLAFTCRHCEDTGLLGVWAFCSCAAGQEREAKRLAELAKESAE